uniref:Uncharacterized protein n=1 Tax=Oryza barthii TaxID=65489 RepID=A0A0D3GUC3_9ORYZ
MAFLLARRQGSRGHSCCRGRRRGEWRDGRGGEEVIGAADCNCCYRDGGGGWCLGSSDVGGGTENDVGG